MPPDLAERTDARPKETTTRALLVGRSFKGAEAKTSASGKAYTVATLMLDEPEGEANDPSGLRSGRPGDAPAMREPVAGRTLPRRRAWWADRQYLPRLFADLREQGLANQQTEFTPALESAHGERRDEADHRCRGLSRTRAPRG